MTSPEPTGSNWNLSIVLIVPAELQDKANRLSCALGHDVLPGNTFSVPLSSDGETVTHYGCRTSAKQEFVDILTAAGAGMLPPGFPDPLEDVQEVLAAQIVDVQDAGQMQTHFDAVLAANELTRISVEAE